MNFKSLLWQWPDGLIWKVTHRVSVGSRKKKFNTFMRVMQPDANTKILDIGVSGQASDERAENFLEEWYEWPENITAVGVDDLSKFKTRYPKIKTVQADARNLSFADGEFDIVFSNAVIEHVGGHKDQQKFVNEALRVGKSVFLTTPSRSFPLESHTMVPFAHYLPIFLRNWIYRKLGRVYEGTKGNLTLLYAGGFRKLFPKGTKVKILKQKLLFFTSVLIAVVKK